MNELNHTQPTPIFQAESVETYLSSHRALAKEMYRICMPVLTCSEIDYVTYTKHYEDRMIHYSTETADQTEFKLKHLKYQPLSSNIEKTSVMSWQQHSNQEFLGEFIRMSQLNNGLLMLYKYPNYSEAISIATRSHSLQLLYSYLNQPDTLINLSCYIKEACRRHQKKIEQRTLYFTEKMDLNAYTQRPSINLPPLRSSKYIIVGNNGETLLTKMEYYCFRNLITLQTSRESGKTLDLSPKTIEAHIAKLKKKLGANNKSDMYQIAKKNGIIII